MKCTTPFKLHVLRPDEKVEGSLQLRNELGNDKVKWLYCNKQRTEAGSEWSINENSAKVNGCPITEDAYRCNLWRWHSPEKSCLQ